MTRRLSVVATLASAVVLSHFVSPAAAQRTKTTTAAANLFLPPPRTLRLHLTRAKKAIAEGEFSDAVQELGTLLAGANLDPELRQLAKQDYFVKPTGKQVGTQLSLKLQAQNLLESMPPKGRELYELHFGAEARALLKQAVAAGDIEQLQDVTRKYFHTKAGYEATMLLGRFQLNQGQPLAAAMSFGRLARSRFGSVQYEPQLSFLLATCLAFANQPQRAQQTLVALKKKSPNAQLKIGGQTIAFFREDKDALTWLQKHIGRLRDFGINVNEQWVVFRGGADRNGKTAGDLPLTTLRWEIPTSNDPGDEMLIRELTKEHRENKLAMLPSLHPLAINNTILMRTARRLIAVEMDSGKRIWEYPWFESREERRLRESRTRLRSTGASPRKEELRQRLWQDMPYGQLSSDGKSVFLVHGLGFIDNSNPYRRIVFRGGRMGSNPNMERDFNRLVSLDLKKEGKLRWMIGGPKGDDESRLAGAFFLGAPLPIMGKLYTLAELNGEIRLVVVNSDSGNLEWAQQLAHVDSRTILKDTRRRLAGATPSFAEGVMVCPTVAGAVVAVDVTNRSLLWGFQYYQPPQTRRNRVFINRYRTPNKEKDAQWADSSVTISQGKVIITPLETNKVYCLDLLTGKKLWEKARSDNLFLACVHGSQAVFVGKSGMTAYKLNDGTTAWQKKLRYPDNSLPSGRGFYTGSHYFIGTTGADLLKIDLNVGKIDRSIKVDRVLGNLICHGDELVSHNVDSISSFFQIEPLRNRVRERLQKNPQDGIALTLKGQLQLYDGKKSQALESLRQAYKLMPEEDETRDLLVKTLLAALETDFAGNQAYAQEVQQLIDQPAQRAAFMRLMARGLHRQKKYAEAFRYYLNLADVDVRTRRFDNQDALEDVGKNLRVRTDRWIQTQLLDLYEKATSAQKQAIAKDVQSRVERALASNSPTRIRRFLDYFEGLDVTTEVRLKFAKKLIDGSRFIEAERQLSRMIGRRSSDQARAVHLMAKLYESAKQTRIAAHYYQLLGSKFATAKLAGGKTGQQVASAAQTRNPLLGSAARQTAAPTGSTYAKRISGTNSQLSSFRQIFPIRITEVRGSVIEPAYAFLDQQMTAINIRNARGKTLASIAVTRPDSLKLYTSHYGIIHGKQHGNILVLSLGFEYVAIDLLRARENPRDALMWRRDFNVGVTSARSNYTPVRTRQNSTLWGFTEAFAIQSASSRLPIGLLGPVTDHGTIIQRNSDLMCVDSITGETIWSRQNVAIGSRIFGDDKYVAILPPTKTALTLIRTADGEVVAKRPWDVNEQFWTSQGRNALVYKSINNMRVLRLFDVVQNQTLWKESVELHSRANLAGPDEVFVMQRNGKCILRSLVDPQRRLEMKLPAQLSLMSVHVLRSKSQYLVAINGSAPQDPQYTYSGIINYPHVPMINGRIHALDRQTGKALWHSPVLVSQFGLPMDQPADAPILTLFRHKMKLNARPRRQRLTVLCLDRRDGTLAAFEDNLSTARNYHIESRPRSNEYVVRLPRNRIVIKLTKDDRPPGAPANIPVAGVRRSAITNAILNIFGTPLVPKATRPAQKGAP